MLLAERAVGSKKRTLDVAEHRVDPLPVREVISATHIIADLTLGLGKVVYDYLNE